MTPEEQAEYISLLELQQRCYSLELFTRFTYPDYECSWHHRLICETLDRFVKTNDIPRLMIFAPPRHGKSELVSRRLPAYIFGNNPDAKIIACSYAADLSSLMNRDVQRIIDSPEYRRLFPHVQLNGENVRTTGSWLRNSDIFEIVNHRGVYRSAGVGGGITGQGADYLIIDDPIKNQEEAESETIRRKIWDWYTTTAYTRLEKNGKVIVMMTRWHQDDLAGKLLHEMQNKRDADRWHVLSLPALCETPKPKYDPRKPGDALWPEKYSTQRMATIRASVGPRTWNALFQQRPAVEGGGIFKRINWRFYDTMPTKFDYVVQSWDMAFKGDHTSDFVAGQVWGKWQNDFYLLDYFRERLSFSDTIKAVKMIAKRWPQARIKLVEDKANGTAVVDLLKHEVPGLLLVNPRGGKVARANAISPLHEAQQIHLPMPTHFDWVNQFIETCANFPQVTHDDDVDAMSQALLYLGGDPRQKLQALLRM